MQQLQPIFSKCNFNKKIFHILKDKEYLYNEPYLKEYVSSNGQKKYKLTIMNCVKNKFVESPSTERKLNKNTEKLDNNLQRSRTVIYEYAYCNKWDFFFTGTLDKTKANREDLKTFNKSFKVFVSNFNRKYNCKIRFLIIPELHSDNKSWHFHGFISNIPGDRIKEFHIGDKMR